MSVPNPNPQPAQPQPFAQNPYAQNPYAQIPHASQASAPRVLAEPGDPYAGAPGSAQPYVPPVYEADPPKPPRPKLTKAAAHRARLAGGVGGGIAWLGLGLMQLCAILLLLPVLVGGLLFGIGFAFAGDGTSATANIWGQTLEWLGSGWGIAIALGIPAGLIIALLGLWLSSRMLRHPGLRRPVGVTWAGFGIAAGGALLLSGLGSVSLPFFGGLPLGLDLDAGSYGFGPGVDPGAMDEAQAQEWFANGGADLLAQIAEPGSLLGFLGPWIALGQLAALIVPIVLGIFTWWWMAHAMRPATTDTTDADGADAGNASAA